MLRRTLLVALPLLSAACSQPAPPPDNADLWSAGAEAVRRPVAARPVMVGGEGPTLPACPSVSRVKAPGTDIFWAPDETRVVKARLPAGARVALCEATPDDRWFGVVFPGPDKGGSMDECAVGRSRAEPSEYQGPCRSGWIRGGTLELGG